MYTFLIILEDFFVIATEVSITRVISIDAYQSTLIVRETEWSTLSIRWHFNLQDELSWRNSAS
jgi:hypothetical protein